MTALYLILYVTLTVAAWEWVRPLLVAVTKEKPNE